MSRNLSPTSNENHNDFVAKPNTGTVGKAVTRWYFHILLFQALLTNLRTICTCGHKQRATLRAYERIKSLAYAEFVN